MYYRMYIAKPLDSITMVSDNLLVFVDQHERVG